MLTDLFFSYPVVKVDHETRRYSCSTIHTTQSIRIWKPPIPGRWPAGTLIRPAGSPYRLVPAHFYHCSYRCLFYFLHICCLQCIVLYAYTSVMFSIKDLFIYLSNLHAHMEPIITQLKQMHTQAEKIPTVFIRLLHSAHWKVNWADRCCQWGRLFHKCIINAIMRIMPKSNKNHHPIFIISADR